MRQLLLLCTLCFSTFLFAQPEKAAEEWIDLFNGKDIDDWVVKIRGHELGYNYGNTFRVEDGLLKVSYDQYEGFDKTFGHIIYRIPFARYKVRVEYRFVGDQVAGGPGWAYRNSGIMVHGQAPESMEVDQEFPNSIEVQLLGGSGKGERSTANLCTPGTHVVMKGELEKRHCTNSNSETFHGDEWVTVEVEVLGNESIIHYVNGEKVLEYEQPQIGGGIYKKDHPDTKPDGFLLNKGYISLQSESHPIEFRKVELLRLD